MQLGLKNMAITSASSTEKAVLVRQHVAYLDGLRAIAALFIIFCHIVLQVNFEGVHLSKWLNKFVNLLS